MSTADYTEQVWENYPLAILSLLIHGHCIFCFSRSSLTFVNSLANLFLDLSPFYFFNLL